MAAIGVIAGVYSAVLEEGGWGGKEKKNLKDCSGCELMV